MKMKTHIKYKGKSLCGAKSRRLQYAEIDGEATCKRCQKAAAK